jgi:hypothetical protein
MTPKLPVKTFRLRAGKIRWLYALPAILLVGAAGIITVNSLFIPFPPGSPLLHLFTLVALALCAFCTVGLVRLRKEHFIGFFISTKGVNDVSTGHNFGLVSWSDVYKIKVMDDLQYPGLQYIVLRVHNPQEYIDRETNLHKKRSMILKHHHYGSPICFSNRGLNCTIDELEDGTRQITVSEF